MKNGVNDNPCKFCKIEGLAGCDNYEQKRDMLQRIIDGQATLREQEIYNTIVNECMDCACRLYCEQELAIKNLLRTKLDKKRVPLDLIDKIKSRIKKSA
jgi:hypothetical protein